NRQNLMVGDKYVWFSINKPDLVTATALYGPDFYKISRGFMNVYGLNEFTQSMREQENILLNTVNQFQTAHGYSCQFVNKSFH
ncbi:UNVERIFIED_CONTAM: hypothetical protein HDU68_000941, partial [Siphonaria sp. JEL0065]